MGVESILAGRIRDERVIREIGSLQELADHRPATVGFVEELDRKRCERPFREDGCGGMSETRLVF